jgi:hypothetical protein
MRPHPTETLLPLTLSEQLNAMLAGWLDRNAPDGDYGRDDQIAAGVITVAQTDVPELEVFCANWDMTVRRSAGVDGRWTVLVVEGRTMLVRGFTEITGMYRS